MTDDIVELSMSESGVSEVTTPQLNVGYATPADDLVPFGDMTL